MASWLRMMLYKLHIPPSLDLPSISFRHKMICYSWFDTAAIVMRTLKELILGLAWPLVVCFALLRFKPAITSLLGRLKSIKALGFEAGSDAEATAQQVASTEVTIQSKSTLVLPADPIIPSIERHERDFISKSFPDDQAAQLSAAYRALAITVLDRNNEMNYRVIFGSQIFILKELNIRAQ
jgi:hypothetical protein